MLSQFSHRALFNRRMFLSPYAGSLGGLALAHLLSQADKPAAMGLSEDEIFGLFDIRARPKRAA